MSDTKASSVAETTPTYGTKVVRDSLAEILSQPTPRADALLGVLSGLGDMTPEQIREERLAKHLK